MPRGRPKKEIDSTPQAPESSVSKGEFEGFKQEVKATQDRILSFLEQMANNQAQANKPRNVMTTGAGQQTLDPIHTEDPDVLPSGSRLPPKYQMIFEKYFDPEDGFTQASLEGTDFMMIVPPKFSNASEAHQKFYKVDIRRIILKPHDIAGGLEAYLKLVARNLRYNRNIRLK